MYRKGDRTMIAELVFVGTEILLGNIVNTNGAFLAEKCAELGLSCYYQTVVGDNEERMKETLKQAISRSDIVIVCGGLGPTPDDLTKEVAAQVMGMELQEDLHTKERIEEYFRNSQWKEIPDSNWKQALVPKGALVLDNSNGTAPGLVLEEKKKSMILLPGPPNEMIPLFMEQVIPYLGKKQPEVIYSKMVKLAGIGESQVAERIQDLIEKQTNPTLATYAKTGEVHLRITAKAKNKKAAKKLLKPIVKELKARFGNAIYTTKENITLEDAVVKLLRKRKWKVTTAESCTGGLLAGRLINAAGASKVIQQGYITYSNKAKRNLLGVEKITLEQYTAVSDQVVYEMAEGGAKAANADVCIAITGLAGPDGGSEAIPVGTVYIGCCLHRAVKVEQYQFKGNRQKIRDYAVVRALNLLRLCILEESE